MATPNGAMFGSEDGAPPSRRRINGTGVGTKSPVHGTSEPDHVEELAEELAINPYFQCMGYYGAHYIFRSMESGQLVVARYFRHWVLPVLAPSVFWDAYGPYLKIALALRRLAQKTGPCLKERRIVMAATYFGLSIIE